MPLQSEEANSLSVSLSLQSLLEPFSKLLSFVIQNAVFTLAYLVELCGLCYRAFTKVSLLCVPRTPEAERPIPVEIWLGVYISWFWNVQIWRRRPRGLGNER